MTSVTVEFWSLRNGLSMAVEQEERKLHIKLDVLEVVNLLEMESILWLTCIMLVLLMLT